MDTVNPYESPATSTIAIPAERLNTLPTVDGECLVVASGTVLPPLCVKTNEPVSKDDLIRKRFDWCSPWIAFSIALGAPILILVYFIARKKCSLTFGLHPHLRRKYRRRMVFKVVATIALFFAIPFSATFDAIAVLIIVMVLFLVALVSLFFGNSPLSVVKYRKGAFWVKGFSREFLAEFAPGSVIPRHR